MELPPKYACTFCGRAVDPRHQTVYRRTTGWAPTSGGRFVLGEPEPGWACKPCIDIRLLRPTDDTLSLF